MLDGERTSIYDNSLSPSRMWLQIRGIYINSSIVDEWGSNLKCPYKIESRFTSIWHPYTNFGLSLYF